MFFAAAASGCADCDVKNLRAATTVAYYDPTIDPRARLEVTGTSSSPSEVLVIENYAGNVGAVPAGQAGAVALGGVNDNYGSCGLCVLGRVNSAILMPLGGTAAVTAPQATNDPFTVSLQDSCVLEEVDPDDSTQVVEGGKRWCFSSGSSFGAATQPWPCSEAPQLDTSISSFNEGDTVCIADPSGPTYVIWQCLNGVITVQQNCVSQNKLCDPSTNPTSTCQ